MYSAGQSIAHGPLEHLLLEVLVGGIEADELEHHAAAELDAVPVLDRDSAVGVEASPVEEGAVGAAFVGERDVAAGIHPDGRVPARDRHVIQRKGILAGAAQVGLVRPDAEHRARYTAPDDDQVGRLPVGQPGVCP